MLPTIEEVPVSTQIYKLVRVSVTVFLVYRHDTSMPCCAAAGVAPPSFLLFCPRATLVPPAGEVS